MEKTIKLIMSVLSMIAPSLKKKDSKHGIKETKEMMIGANEVSLFMCEKLKDGVQFSDGVDFYNKITQDEIFKQKMVDAYDNFQKIPTEIEDADGGEGIELAVVQINYIPRYIECFKKKEVL